jgi:tetratricopeptide (TPR) repeat protein
MTFDTRIIAAGLGLCVLLGMPLVLHAQEAAAELELVPHPELSGLKPEVRARLEPSVEYFRRQRVRADGRQLGLAYGRLGMSYLAQEQQAAAGACFRNAAALDPGNSRWPYLLGVHYEENGQLEEAAASYETALRLDFAYTPTLLRGGRVLLKLGRVDEAETQFMLAYERNKQDAAALAGLGQVAFERNQYEQAIDLYEAALAAQPEASQLHYRIGLAYRALGERDKAAASLERAGERIPSIDDPLLAFVMSHARGSQVYKVMAAQALQAGNVAEAIQLFGLATSIDPGDTESLSQMGQLQGASGDLTGAATTFARILALDANDPAANFYLGTILEQLGRETDAEAHYRKALEANPALVEPRLLLGNTLMRQGRYTEAGDHYARVVSQLPEDVEAMHLLGHAWLAADQCQWAHPVLRRALSRAPGDAQLADALARAYAICPDATEEQRRQALQMAQAIYEKEPGVQSAETLAMTSAANGAYADAVDFQAQAIFELLKQEDQGRLDWMRGNMERYQAGQPAQSAWPEGADVYRPARLSPPPPTDGPQTAAPQG